MSPRDKGGWSSKGSRVDIRCPKCGEDHATMLETYIYGRTSHRVFCNTCSHDWAEQERDDDEGDSDR